MSDRQIYRLKKKFKEEVEKGFIHKNRRRESDNKLLEKLGNLYFTEYYDYSIEAFYEKIKSNYKISYDAILKND